MILPYKIFDIPNLDLSLPEFVYREEFAKKLFCMDAPDILKNYVYTTKQGMNEIIQKTEREILGNLCFSGVGVELGAGTGLLSAVIAQNQSVENIYAVEIVKNMVELIIPKISNHILGVNSKKIIPTYGSFDSLGLENNSIDFIVEIGSLHHSSNLTKTLKEAHRVLKSDGFLICYDRSHRDTILDVEINELLNIKYSKEFLISNGYPENLKLTRAENGEHEIRICEWKNSLRNAGFKIKQIKYFINPSLKTFLKGLFFLLPFCIRKHLKISIDYNYDNHIKYYFDMVLNTNLLRDTIVSCCNFTVFLATKK